MFTLYTSVSSESDRGVKKLPGSLSIPVFWARSTFYDLPRLFGAESQLKTVASLQPCKS